MVKSKPNKPSKNEGGSKKEEAVTRKLKVKNMPDTHKDSKTKTMPGKRQQETQDAKDTAKKARVQKGADAKDAKATKIHKTSKEA